MISLFLQFSQSQGSFSNRLPCSMEAFLCLFPAWGYCTAASSSYLGMFSGNFISRMQFVHAVVIVNLWRSISCWLLRLAFSHPQRFKFHLEGPQFLQVPLHSISSPVVCPSSAMNCFKVLQNYENNFSQN